jgi:RHS repeat-associated protein
MNNVEEEKLYGNLQGAQTPPIQLNEKGLPIENPSIPCHTRKRQYSKDGFNLLVNQGEPKNGSVRYVYKPGTALVTAKLVCDKGGIKKRSYFEYDENAFLVRQTCDDGTAEEKKFSCSEKHIAQFVLTKGFPAGLPLVIEEKYYDNKSGQECTLRKQLMTYDTSGRIVLEEVEGRDGTRKREASYTYDQAGQCIEGTDASGATTYYSYDDYGSLIEKGPAAYTEFFFYNDQRNLAGKQRRYSSGVVLEERYEYDQFGNKTSSTDPFGNTTTYEYDSFNRLVKVVHPEVATKDHGLAHPVYRYTYDGMNRRISMEDPLGNRTQYTYTARGEPASILYPDRTSEAFSYDSEGSLHRKTTQDGRVLAYGYDFLGRLTKVETFSQEDTGPGEFLGMCQYRYSTLHLVETDNGLHYITRAKYNAAGALEGLEGRYGWNNGEEPPKTEFEYDAFGTQSGHKEWFGSGEKDYIHTSIHADAAGHITEKVVSDPTGKTVSRVTCSYDALGNRTQTAMQGEPAELIEYNEFGEPTKVTDAQGRTTTFAYNHNDVDEKGQRVFTKTATDPCGTQKIQRYDSRGLLVSSVSQSSSGLLLEREEYVYDLRKNLAEKRTFVVHDGFVLGQQTTLYTYDSMGRPLSIDTEGKKTAFEYNNLGLISKRYVPGYSEPIKYSYHYAFRELRVKITFPLSETPQPSDSSLGEIWLIFDPSGCLTRASSIVDGTRFERKIGYNGQILEETIWLDILNGYTVKTSTDRMGRTKAITLPDSSSIQYRYESTFLREVTRVSCNGTTQYTHKYVDYDRLGNLTRESCIGDTGERLSGWASGKKKRSVITDFYREHIEKDKVDPLGNILGTYVDAPRGEVSSSFTYDPLSHLLSEQGLFSHTYTCDSIGNRRSVDGGPQSVDSLNRLLASDTIVNTYDQRGCLQSKTTPLGTTGFRYDIFNHLLSIASGGRKVQFTYDGLGRRITQKEVRNGEETFLVFLYFNGEEIGQVSLDGTIEQLKIPGLESPVAFEFHKRAVAPIFDLHSNVVALIDPETRELVESYAYSAFGEEKIFDQDNDEVLQSPLGNPWRFAGKRKEELSGLILFEKRAYDPSLRCWTTPDPAGEVDGPNLYLFSRGNPLVFGDPRGLSAHSHYVCHENFAAYMASGRGTPQDRGGELGLIEHSSEVHPPACSERNFVTLFSLKYSEEQIVERLKTNPKFSKRVIGHINGMNCDYETVCKRAKWMIENSHGSVDAVLIAYNGTSGWLSDTGEAIANVFRTDSQVVQDIRAGLIRFFDQFRRIGVEIEIAFHCHSQGAAIMDCIRHSEGFIYSRQGGYSKFIGKTFTYGAATFLDFKKGEGVNFWAPGDVVPLLNPKNYGVMILNHNCVKFTSFRIQFPSEAHTFEGASYQEAFQGAVSSDFEDW